MKARRSALCAFIAANIGVSWVGLFSDTASAAALEEVIVTARKREENLQALPTAINAFQPEQLETQQISDIQKLQDVLPNVTFSGGAAVGGGTLGARIRGIGDEGGFAAGVGIYIDDIYMANTAGQILDVYDVQRIEILKGPQGSLYGRNTIGGAIRYVTRDPSDQLEATLQEKIGSRNLRDTIATVSGPLVDDLSGSAAITRKQQDGLQTNIYDGSKLDNQNSWAARAMLQWAPASDLTVKYSTDWLLDRSRPQQGQRIYSSPTLAIISGIAAPLGLPSDPTATWHPGKDQVASDLDYGTSYNRRNAQSLTTSWEQNSQWTHKVIAAYLSNDFQSPLSLDGSSAPMLDAVSHAIYFSERTLELQSNYAGDGVDGVMGLYYFKGHTNTRSQAELTPLILAFSYREQLEISHVDELSRAFYTNWDFDLTQNLHLTLGGRNNWDTSKTDFYNPEIDTVVLPTPQSPTTSTVSGSPQKSWKKFTKTIKLSYDVATDNMLYASYSEGFKQGGFNALNGAENPAFDPEEVKSYAVGLKSTLFNESLRINTEIFYNDYRNKQFATTVQEPNGAIVGISANAGKETTQGVDIDTVWATPIDGLTLNGSLGYLDANVDKFDKALSSGVANIADTVEVGFAPRWTANLGALYELPVGEGDKMQFSVNASYRYKTWATSPMQSFDYSSGKPNYADLVTAVPEYTTYNAMIAYVTNDERWRIALEGRNLSDQRVIQSSTNVAGLFTNVAYTDPRSWAATVRYKFK
ncbi:MAG TPA: TonB-dependent receptor [Spongiibacteraceae bacterium]|jgi:iron complex outermembrane receptor protein